MNASRLTQAAKTAGTDTGFALDSGVVHVVFGEIQQSMTQARMELERYVQPEVDDADMGACIDLIRAVGGVVTMLEVDGAALLLEEMLAVAQALATSPEQPNPDQAAALMGALVELPAYLERRRAARRENPLLLVQTLNELRTTLGKPLLSESSLFSPPLDVDVPPGECVGTGAAVLSARQLRAHLQFGLVAWLTDKDAPGGLRRMDAVFARLLRDTAPGPAGRMWWIARAVVEGILTDGIESTLAVKRLFSQLDAQLKALCGAEPAPGPPESLLKNLLYYVGMGEATGPRMQAVVAAFGLDELLDARAGGQSSLASRQALQSAARALGEDIDELKRDLDDTHGAGAWTAGDLDQIEQRFRQLTDMLGLLGHEDLRRSLMAELHPERSGTAETSIGETRILALASALLSVESAMRLQADAAWSAAAPSSGQDDAPRDALRQLLGAFFVEIKAELFLVKEHLSTLAAGASDDEFACEGAAAGLGSLMGCLRLLRLDELADEVEEHRTRLASVPDAPALEEDFLEALADVVIDVEQRLAATVAEGVSSRPAGPDAIGDAPRRSRRAPRVSSGAPRRPGRPAGVGPERGGRTAGNVPPAGCDEAAADGDVALPEDDPHEELIEIFLEEVDEILEDLPQQAQRWLRAPDDEDSRTAVRRAFHTVKGSGRVAGAHRMGEFAWAVENLLNRVGDGQVDATQEVVDLVTGAVDMLGELRDALRAPSAVVPPIQPWMHRANELARAASRRRSPA